MLSFRYQLLIFAGTIRVLGFVRAIEHEYNSRWGKGLVKIQPFGYKVPIYLRGQTSDYNVFFQVITSKGYKLHFPFKPETIIDLGANIGLTSVYFKNVYPEVKIIAVEPEKNNFDLLKKNTEQYKDIICLHNGIWDKNCFLKIVDNNVEKCAFEVEETVEKTDIHAISISNIVKEYNLKSIDILKIDIEGSEKQIFTNGFEEWLPLVKVLMIELHDLSNPGCSMAVFKSLSGYDYYTDFQGETLVIKFNHVYMKDNKSE
jgi:FkbM family methyltransferase